MQLPPTSVKDLALSNDSWDLWVSRTDFWLPARRAVYIHPATTLIWACFSPSVTKIKAVAFQEALSSSLWKFKMWRKSLPKFSCVPRVLHSCLVWVGAFFPAMLHSSAYRCPSEALTAVDVACVGMCPPDHQIQFHIPAKIWPSWIVFMLNWFSHSLPTTDRIIPFKESPAVTEFPSSLAKAQVIFGQKPPAQWLSAHVVGVYPWLYRQLW